MYVTTMRIARLVCFTTALACVGQVATAQDHDVPPDTIIRLQRTSCFGSCPIYAVTIDAHGAVTYVGERFVRVVGEQRAHIAPSAVAMLLARAEAIGFFEMRDSYRVLRNPNGEILTVTDLPTKIVTITANGRTKRVEDYAFSPDALGPFELDIDRAAGTKRWVFLDDEALDELTRSNWSASGEEGAKLLQESISKDEVSLARRLIELGADLGGPADNRLPPLMLATSAAMVDLLVKAGANPNERPIGRVSEGPPLISANYKSAGYVEALLKAGARLEDTDHGKTALWYAACAGNVRVVEVLLRAGANPRGSSDMSALACTREARQTEANRRLTARSVSGRPSVEDFDQVIALLESAEKRLKR
jgi:hypothetical protein